MANQQNYTPVSAIPSYKDKPVQTDSEIDALLVQAASTEINGQRSAAPLGSAIGHILKNNPTYRMSQIEARLRALAIDSYLLAIPARHAPTPTVAKMIPSGKKAKYYLFIAVNGEIEVRQLTTKFQLDYATNSDRLDETGVLTLRAVN